MMERHDYDSIHSLSDKKENKGFSETIYFNERLIILKKDLKETMK